MDGHLIKKITEIWYRMMAVAKSLVIWNRHGGDGKITYIVKIKNHGRGLILYCERGGEKIDKGKMPSMLVTWNDTTCVCAPTNQNWLQ